MIAELLLDIIYTIISFVLTPINIVFEPIGALSGLLELLAYGSIFIPLQTLGICLTIWYMYYFTRFIVVAINWVIGKIPTIT